MSSLKPFGRESGGEVVLPVVPLRESDKIPTNEMSYDVVQRRAAECMRRIREFVAQLDELPDSANPMTRVRISQNLRNEEQEAKWKVQEAKRLSIVEKRSDDFDTLNHFYQSTLRLIRERRGFGLPATIESKEEESQYRDEGNYLRTSTLSLEGNFTPREDVPGIYDTAEFEQFYRVTQKNDVFIDESLDRVYEGVLRLNGNATNIASELKVQDEILNGTEQKVDRVHGKLGQLNKKFREAIRKLGPPMLFMYSFCCLSLTGVIIVLYFVISS